MYMSITDIPRYIDPSLVYAMAPCCGISVLWAYCCSILGTSIIDSVRYGAAYRNYYHCRCVAGALLLYAIVWLFVPVYYCQYSHIVP
jgi:hypothetical protein